MISLKERTKNENEYNRTLIESYLIDLRVASPGIIQSVDHAKQTCTVQISVREQVNINGNLQWLEIPVLLDVPFYFPRGGGYMMTFPVKRGDECLVVFADFCIDAWWQNGGVQNQSEKRRHDLSDGFALIGFTSQPRKVSDYSTDSLMLRNESNTNYIEVAEDEINIQAVDSINMAAGDSINLTSAEVNLNGVLKINGSPYLAHAHNGVTSGGGTTGGVVG